MKSILSFIFSLFCFFIQAQTIKLDSSNLPICIIDTRGKTIANEPKILAHMKIIYNGPGKTNSVKDLKYNYNNFIAIEIRGNSSQSYPQKQYGIELRDSVSGNDLDTSILDMPKEEDWILYAPYNDISLLRNVMTYHFWNEMGHWGPRTRLCELVLNNEYVGVYIMMESIKRDPNRVDVSKMTTTDTSGLDRTGGYIMKVDKKNNASDLSFVSKVKSTTNQDITWLYHYPDSKDIKPVQQNYIRNFIDTVELLMASSKFADPLNGYKKYLGVNTFIDYFLISEFSRNIDAYKASSYFYKEKLAEDGSEGKLKAGPVWDYNFAFGNASFCSGGQTNGWMYDGCVPATLPTPIIWRRLLADSNYVNMVKCRYLELRKTIWDTSYLFQYLNKYAFDTLDAAQKRHFTKWKILGTNPGGFNAYVASSYPDEMNRLKNWIRNRLTWMDANLPGRCFPPPAVAKIEIPLDPECFSGNRPTIQKNHPFNTAPFNYQGMEKISTIPADIIRWVLVELRDPLDSTKIVDRRAALLRSDSVLVDTNFKAGVFFPKAIGNQDYVIVVRYDALAFLMSKEKVELPNDNDYNLNRGHNVNTISNQSPIIYTSDWLGVDTLFICEGKNLYIRDTNLIKLGYSFVQHSLTTSGPHIDMLNTHEAILNFDSAKFYTFEIYLNCNNQSTIRSRINVKVWPNPVAHILGPDSFCLNDSIKLQSDLSKYYYWNTGERSQAIWVNQPAKYDLQVYNEHNCISTTSKVVTQFPEIKGTVESIAGTQSSACKFYFVPENPFYRYTYLWSTGAISDTIETNDKLVTLTVSDSNQCKKEYSMMCSLVSNVDPNINAIQIIPNPSNGSFSIISPFVLHDLRIYSSTGVQVYPSKSIEVDLFIGVINFNHFSSGIYFGKTMGDGKQIVFKIVVR
ncbi:MAG: CotH kinase family protein [Saprospiraceae bacterium]|uniref:CotH kinase family protein n=1 Tax=Candidatus Defluviibacterium haderslevense TaxID=2981993 RepID=A0A9D7SBS2_9BACT|nr:CotH kinase family protein [Candidatus Defluviibacterium haderslevense]